MTVTVHRLRKLGWYFADQAGEVNVSADLTHLIQVPDGSAVLQLPHGTWVIRLYGFEQLTAAALVEMAETGAPDVAIVSTIV